MVRFLRVQPPFEFLEPRFNPRVFEAVRLFVRPYLLSLKVTRIRTENIETAVDQFRDFFEGKTRLIIAFRHSHVNDGPLLFHLFANLVPAAARKSGEKLPGTAHVHYVYARNVPLWSGRAAAWLFPRVGGVPVLKGGAESRSLSLLRRYLVESPFPIAVAPEAQVSYHGDSPGPLDPGACRLALWCAEDLAKAGRDMDVRILPVMNSYAYSDPGLSTFERLLARTERECGITGYGREENPFHGDLSGRAPWRRYYDRLLRLLDALLNRMEFFYTGFHGIPLTGTGFSRQERLDRIVDAALRTGERFFGLSHSGTSLERVLAVRTRGLSRIFRDDLPPRNALCGLDSGLADRIAAESYYMLNHMELADVLEYVRDGYLSPESDFSRYVETLADLADIVSRLEGGNISGRPDVFRKRVTIRIGNPIPLSSFMDGSPVDRKKVVESLTGELGRSFLRLTATGAGN